MAWLMGRWAIGPIAACMIGVLLAGCAGSSGSSSRSSRTGATGGAAGLSFGDLSGASRGQASVDTRYGVSASPIANGRRGGGSYKIGKPYQIAGQWYVPRHEPGYDRVGVASWYGPGFHGRYTANGEVFNADALTAAHPTLPLPSLVEVTNIETGLTALVRVNDRGPYARGRLIDLSRRVAHILGITKHGTARVRVRYIGPAPLDGNDRAERQYLERHHRTAQAR